MIKTDKVAILLATYNGEKYVEEQLDSLLNQTNQDWIVYIHDDGSIDSTCAIIDKYCFAHPDHFVKIKGEPTGGAKNNFYFLLRKVEAPYYMFCDQDDVWLADKIEKSKEKIILEDNIPCMAFSDLKIVDSKRNVIADSLWNYYKFDMDHITIEKLIVRNVVTGCTIILNKMLRDLMIRFNNIENVPMHDKWAALLALKFGKMIKINKSLILYRQHENNTIGAIDNRNVSVIFNKVKNRKRIHSNYEYTWRQAKELSEVFELDRKDAICKYASLGEHCKIVRLYIYIKYGFFTESISQCIGLLISG